MQEKLKIEGKCLFCEKTFSKAGINRHLATHLKEKEKTGELGKSFFVKIETNKKWGVITPYFLSLWIDGEAKMRDLDSFLRDIWLECCGHLSAFKDPSGEMSDLFEYDDDEEDDYEDDPFGFGFSYDSECDIPMRCKMKDVLRKGLELEYEYDFGDTTELSVTVIDEYAIKADEDIVLLSRNEPLKIMCSACGKAPTTQICTACMDHGNAEFCDKCAEKHAEECEDFADYAAIPVVNSPRMGVCGYMGGTIDMERDVCSS